MERNPADQANRLQYARTLTTLTDGLLLMAAEAGQDPGDRGRCRKLAAECYQHATRVFAGVETNQVTARDHNRMAELKERLQQR